MTDRSKLDSVAFEMADHIARVKSNRRNEHDGISPKADRREQSCKPGPGTRDLSRRGA